MNPILTGAALVVSGRMANVMLRLGLRLLDPKGIRERGIARADVRRYERLCDAQARKDLAGC